MIDSLLDVRDLHTHFRVPHSNPFAKKQWLRAVDGVSFQLSKGEVLSLVGESGCGKTTVGRTLTRLEQAASGSAVFDGTDILALSQKQFRPIRRDIQMIFQDPFASLNPRLTIEQILREPLFIHKLASSNAQAREMIEIMLEKVGLDRSVVSRYPHEFSGGQRQRIGIARVMIVKPKLVVADEAVSALDVSIQAQVLNLLKQLQRDSGIAMLFISHDLAVVRHISDRIAVMYQGKIVETAEKRTLFDTPQHAYTQRLLASIPRIPSIRQVS
ncbi:MAG: ATP-binding cassette domain-containing protein [Granulosicoccus sp.]|nr:ATP-binding cassette domain-containing protein [Granulosicoccus sp.]